MKRSVREIPVPAIKTKSVIDHNGSIPRMIKGVTVSVWHKDGLPTISVASPFIEHEDAEKIREIPYRAELLVRQKIVNHHSGRVDGEPRSKLFACRARYAA